jgi:hypothetical protein
MCNTDDKYLLPIVKKRDAPARTRRVQNFHERTKLFWKSRPLQKLMLHMYTTSHLHFHLACERRVNPHSCRTKHTHIHEFQLTHVPTQSSVEAIRIYHVIPQNISVDEFLQQGRREPTKCRRWPFVRLLFVTSRVRNPVPTICSLKADNCSSLCIPTLHIILYVKFSSLVHLHLALQTPKLPPQENQCDLTTMPEVINQFKREAYI